MYSYKMAVDGHHIASGAGAPTELYLAWKGDIGGWVCETLVYDGVGVTSPKVCRERFKISSAMSAPYRSASWLRRVSILIAKER